MRLFVHLASAIRRRSVILAILGVLLIGGIVSHFAFRIADGSHDKPVSQMVYPFNPFPEGFERNTMNLKPGGVCYLIVHPGYELYTDIGTDVISNGEVYGDYSVYIENLDSLLEQLRREDALVIYALEERVLKQPSLLPSSLRPPPTALRIMTRDASGLVEREFTDKDGVRRSQTISPIVDFLKANGVTEMRVAGEAAWYPGPNGYRGCLATLAGRFMDSGFRITGVEGCVHPSKRLPTESFIRKCFDQDPFMAWSWSEMYGYDVLERMTTDPVLRGIYMDTSG